MAHKGRPLSRPTNTPGKARTLLEGAKKLGITYKRAKRLRDDGWATDASGRLDLAEGQELLAARQERAPGGNAGLSQTAITWKERKLKAQALREEIELAEHTKQLVPITEVRRVWGLQATNIKNALVGLGRAIAPLVAHKGPIECQTIIDRRILEILKELAHGDYHPGA